jgi:1-acyl-sn-glycerol-3-phosphate acyltransferase
MPVAGTLRTLEQFMQLPGAPRVLFDMALIGVSGGLFIVPLYAMVQQRTAAAHRARVIAANNILNALLMVLAAVAGMLLLGVADLSKSQYFMVLALVNAAVACYIYAQAPEFTMRFIIWLLGHSMYRVKHIQLRHIPATGPAVLVCNHVSYVDALLLGGAIRRPVRFVMNKSIYDMAVLNFVFRTGRAIPIASASEDPQACDQAYESISRALQQGHLVCIFPEGQLTRTGELGEFKKGVEKIIARDPVPVVPLALRGLWGSFFSHADGRALAKWPRRVFARLDLIAGEPVAAETVSAELLQARVLELRGPVS